MNLLQKFNLEDTGKYPIPIPNFGRDQMAQLFAEEGFNLGVEIGVAHGEYSEVLLKANPNLKLYGVDPYMPLKGYLDYTKESTFNQLMADAEARLAPFGDRYEHIREMSVEAAQDFENNSLDFVYIDGNHDFRNVIDDVDTWKYKVKPGGILYGHDYARTKGAARMHVRDAVPPYMAVWKMTPWFVLGNEANNEGLIRDASRSWAWQK